MAVEVTPVCMQAVEVTAADIAELGRNYYMLAAVIFLVRFLCCTGRHLLTCFTHNSFIYIHK